MRHLLLLAVYACLSVPAFAADAERDAVVKVVTDAYIDGVHKTPSSAAMRAGFHPDFRMLVLANGRLDSVALEEWISRLEKAAATSATAKRPEVRAEIPNVEVTGTAANVRVEIWRDGKHVFSDYLLLYKLADGWKIVAKTFYTHP